MPLRPSIAPSARTGWAGRCALGLAAALAATGCRPSPDAPPDAPPADTARLDTPAPGPGVLPGRVVFVSERDGDGGEIHAFDGTAGTTTRLTTRPGADFPVDWIGGGSGGLLVVSAEAPEDDEEAQEAPAQGGHAHGGERVSLARLDTAGRLHPLRVTARTLRNLVVSQDGGAVVFEADFASLRDLFRYDVATDRLTRLTTTETGAFDPSLSPAADRIAYATSREGNAELYVMPATGEGPDGRDALRLTAFHRDDIAPRWSPDGRSIAFVSDREGAPRLFVVAPDGTGLRRLLAASDTLGETLAEGPATWSPDSRRIAFEVTPASGGAQLWVTDAATGARTRLATALRSATQPAWSPDGRFVAFTGLRPGDADSEADVYAVEVETGRLLRLTDAPGPDWLPRWLP